MVDKQVKTELKTNAKQNTIGEGNTPFECSTCHQSIRFFTLYMFNEAGALAQIVLGQGPALIMCAGCRTVYRWEPSTEAGGGHDGGWVRDNLFEDALSHQKRTESAAKS